MEEQYTVEELIEKLRSFNPKARVFTSADLEMYPLTKDEQLVHESPDRKMVFIG